MLKHWIKGFLVFFIMVLGGLFEKIHAFPQPSTQDDYTDAKYIAHNFWEGVVKILVYDPVVEEKFHLKKGDGYLTRGSGFIVTPKGIVFTNRHVIEWCVYGYMVADWQDPEGVMHQSDVLTYKPGLELRPEIKKVYYIGHATPLIQVFTDETGKTFELYKAEVVSMGEVFDGAMLRIVSLKNGSPVKKLFKALPLGNSDKTVIGEDLVILGYPSQYEKSDFALDLRDTLTMSYGKQSGWDYVFDDIYGFIKTNASVHEGNSGGPVFGEEEKVIGIATAMGVRTQIGLVEGINGMYYVVEPHKQILKELVNNGLTPPNQPKRFIAVSGKPRALPTFSNLKKVEDPLHVGALYENTLSIKGVVYNSDSRSPVEGAQVFIWSVDKGLKKVALLCKAVADIKGKFSMPRSVPLKHKYLIVVKREDYKDLEQNIELASPDQNFLPIYLQPKS